MKPDAGHAAYSAVGALSPQLTAGQMEVVTVTARDAAGNATAGGDRVRLMLDSVAEGGIRLVGSKWSWLWLFCLLVNSRWHWSCFSLPLLSSRM